MNGCTLENCHTNLFSLTDIAGIKWQQLRNKSPDSVFMDPLDDPVLQAFSRCLSAELLVAWRKVRGGGPGGGGVSATDAQGFKKELWLFWYGDDPPGLQELLGDKLQVEHKGSWEDAHNGLSYRIRTLLFKALHNVIQKCLLSRGFVQLGKWFVQPADRATPIRDLTSQLSFAFSFFLHGESTVCASVEVRQHDIIAKLPQDLLNGATVPQPYPVILAPYGMAGLLTGNVFAPDSAVALKVVEEWERFYPLLSRRPRIASEDSDEEEGEPSSEEERPDPPHVVEVLVGNTRLKYPSSYILTVHPRPRAEGVVPVSARAGEQGEGQLPGGLGAAATGGAEARTPGLCRGEGLKVVGSMDGAEHTEALVFTATEHLFHAIQRGSNPESTQDTAWEFCDPTCKSSCACARLKGRKGQHRTNVAGGGTSAGTQGVARDRPSKPPESGSPSRTPFHKRMATGGVPEGSLSSDMPGGGRVSSAASATTPEAGAFTPMVPSVQTPGSNAANSVQPPTSQQSVATDQGLAESPPGSTQPVSNRPGAGPEEHGHEPVMPVLSPQPPTKPDSKDSGHGEAGRGEMWRNTMAGLVVPLKRPALPAEGYDTDPFESGSDDDSGDVVARAASSAPATTRAGYWPDRVVKRCRVDEGSPGSSINGPPPPPSSGAVVNQAELKRDPFEFGGDQDPLPFGLGDTSLPPHTSSTSNNQPTSVPNDKGRHDHPDTNGFSPPSDGLHTLGGPNMTSSLMESLPSNIFESDEEDDGDGEKIGGPTGPNNAVVQNGGMKGGGQDGKIGTSLASSAGSGTIAGVDLAHIYPTPPSNCSAQSPGGVTDHEVPAPRARHDTARADDSPAHRHAKDVCLLSSVSLMSVTATSQYGEVPGGHTSTPQPPAPPSTLLPGVAYRPETASFYARPWTDRSLDPFNRQPLVPMQFGTPQPPHQPLGGPRSVSTPLNELGLIPRNTPTPRTPVSMETSPYPQRTPLSYLDQSPGSVSSLNKTLNSVENAMTHTAVPEASGLVANVALSDSVLSLYKDVNFDSCTICACNQDIKGRDVGVYLPDTDPEPGASVVPASAGFGEEELNPHGCECGFSAVRNRALAISSGLFYEDEVEITGQRHDRYEVRKRPVVVAETELIPSSIVALVRQLYCSALPNSLVLHHRLRQRLQPEWPAAATDNMAFNDGCNTAVKALELSRFVTDSSAAGGGSKQDDKTLHPWPFNRGTSQEVSAVDSALCCRLLTSLQPLLQRAVRQKHMSKTWDPENVVKGPLTWQKFHRIAGPGSEPQPIPSFLVGYDRDWLTVAPHLIREWEKHNLEPYARARSLSYVVVAPENEIILTKVVDFFRDLSAMYEGCRLGKHFPLLQNRKGILPVGKTNQSRVADLLSDDWFAHLKNPGVREKIKLYDQICRKDLGPELKKEMERLEKISLDPFNPPPPDYQSSFESKYRTEAPKDSEEGGGIVEGDSEKPGVVVYLVEPMTYGSTDDQETRREAYLGLLKCFANMTDQLPDAFRNRVQLEFVPLSTILDYGGSREYSQVLRSLALSVYGNSRRPPPPSLDSKCFTNFGPLAGDRELVQTLKDAATVSLELQNFIVRNPPFILAPHVETKGSQSERLAEQKDRANTLFCGYCLSQDQRWLLATVTDGNGEQLDTQIFNIDIPNRNRRKKASARKIGLSKLWQYLLRIMSRVTSPWRLIIGKLGRLGHGEVKGWAGILSQGNLQSMAGPLNESCHSCRNLPPTDKPVVASACLVSIEPHDKFRVMVDEVQIDEKATVQASLHTPQDASATHIFVFPISAKQHLMAAQAPENVLDLGGFDLFGDIGLGPDLEESDLDGITDGMDLNFGDIGGTSHDSPLGGTENKAEGGDGGGKGRDNSKREGPERDPQDEVSAEDLQQQPLAMGYYVTTAPLDSLPAWFWTPCPEASTHNPPVLRAALHVRTQAVDSASATVEHSGDGNRHPMDSSQTCDVLRYVLESYNALSWLTFDLERNDRRSGLPLHLAVLCQLYSAVEDLV